MSGSHFNLPDTDSVWRPWKNIGGESVPPFGLIKLADVEDIDGQLVLVGSRPTGEGGYLYMVNGPLSVQPDKPGSCHARWPAFVALETDAVIAAGRMLGIRANESKLRADRHGFISAGARHGGRLLVYPDYSLALIELTANLSGGGSAAAKFVNSSGTATAETLTVYDRVGTFNANPGSGKRGYVKWNAEADRYELVQLAC